MTQRPNPISLRPSSEDNPRYADAVWRRSFVRACASHVFAQATNNYPGATAERQWPGDRDAVALAKGAVSPATTTTAAALTQTTPNSLGSLSPSSASAQFLAQTLQLSFNGASLISVPGFVADAANVGFVAEGAPIPVRQLSVAPLWLEPSKLATIIALTREMAEGSNAEALISDCLKRSVGLALDAALFGTDAAVADTRPAGLRNGIAALVATSGTDPAVAMIGDVGKVLAAVSAVAGNTPPVLVAAPARAGTLRLLGGFGISSMTILASSAIAAGDLIAIAPNGIVSATGGAPEISASTETVLHMSDTPTNLGVAGSPATVAAPAQSMFQSDVLALKCRMMATWARRDNRAVAWLTATAW